MSLTDQRVMKPFCLSINYLSNQPTFEYKKKSFSQKFYFSSCLVYQYMYEHFCFPEMWTGCQTVKMKSLRIRSFPTYQINVAQ